MAKRPLDAFNTMQWFANTILHLPAVWLKLTKELLGTTSLPNGLSFRAKLPTVRSKRRYRMKFDWKSAIFWTLFSLGFTLLYFLWIVFVIYFIAGSNTLIAILLGIIPTIIILFILFGMEDE